MPELQQLAPEEPGVRCPWRREQIRSAHGGLSTYGRQCDLELGHHGLHVVPPAAKQSSRGVWYNPVTGRTSTQ
jgi:hypothetical protein